MHLPTPSTSTRRTAARLALLSTAICVLVGATAPAARAQSDGVTATLAAARTSFASGDRVVVQLTLENSGDAAVGLLRWLTPEDGVGAPSSHASSSNGMPTTKISSGFEVMAESVAPAKSSVGDATSYSSAYVPVTEKSYASVRSTSHVTDAPAPRNT